MISIMILWACGAVFCKERLLSHPYNNNPHPIQSSEFSFLSYIIPPDLSSFRFPVSSIQHPVSSCQLPVASCQLPVSYTPDINVRAKSSSRLKPATCASALEGPRIKRRTFKSRELSQHHNSLLSQHHNSLW